MVCIESELEGRNFIELMTSDRKLKASRELDAVVLSCSFQQRVFLSLWQFLLAGLLSALKMGLQGYLAHKKTPPPRTLQ